MSDVTTPCKEVIRLITWLSQFHCCCSQTTPQLCQIIRRLLVPPLWRGKAGHVGKEYHAIMFVASILQPAIETEV